MITVSLILITVSLILITGAFAYAVFRYINHTLHH